MALTGSTIFVINILFGVCIGHLFAYEILWPVRGPMPLRGPMPRGIPIPIPIRPLDHSTIRRLSRRPTELNPDSESVFLPMHQAKHRPMQIMERISVPVDGNHNWNRQKKDNFNVLNFEAYVMKPTNEAAIPKPVTERILHLINKTDYERDDTRQSPSSSHHKYRSRSAPKKPKKNPHVLHMKEFDDLEFYRAFLEHQKHAAMVKRIKPKPDSSSRLPIGIDFFENNKKKNKMAFPPITYSPLYLNNLHRSQQYEDVEASNVQQVKIRHPDMLKNEEMPSTQATTPFASLMQEQMQTTMIVPMESEKHDETMPPPSDGPIDPESFHGFASEPEMYKFTIDDVVKPNALGLVNHPFTGPVTLSPPPMMYKNTPNSNFMMRSEPILPASANTIHESRFEPHFHTQLSYPPKVYQRGTAYRRFQANSFRNVPIEASASSHQQMQKYSIEPIVMTTQMTFATDTDPNVAPSVKANYEIDSKRVDNKRNNKKRRINTERHKPETTKKVNHQKDSLNNNLEFSSSYSKRRTQGYNSEEETATTPITLTKSRNNNNINKNETKQQHQQQQQQETITTINTPKNEKVKYFQ